MRSIAVSNKMLSAAQASYEGSPEYGLTDSDMRKAIKMALREAPDQQSDLAAARAEIERLTKDRDEALALLADAYGAGTGGSVIESHLADAERDMRQRAAELIPPGNLRQEVLALPLKHADREGGA